MTAKGISRMKRRKRLKSTYLGTYPRVICNWHNLRGILIENLKNSLQEEYLQRGASENPLH